MQSENQKSIGKKMGHVRRQSYGKIMPISSLLNNLTGFNAHFESSSNQTPTDDHIPVSQSFETLALNSRVNERSDGDNRQNVTDSTLNFINHEKMDDAINQTQTLAQQPSTKTDEIDIEKTFLKCINYHPREMQIQNTINAAVAAADDDIVTTIDDAKSDEEDNIDRVLIDADKNNGAPCLICTKKDTEPFKHSLMNMLCKKLCDESCNTSTKTCQSNDSIITHADHDVDSSTATGEDDGDTMLKAENILQRSNSSRQEFLASMLTTDDFDKNIDNDSCHVAPLTMENLKQFNDDYFREKLAIAEALANTSMMTSTAAKNRLAARKIEMSLNTPDFVYDPENAEYIPPKELLMYLVR